MPIRSARECGHAITVRTCSTLTNRSGLRIKFPAAGVVENPSQCRRSSTHPAAGGLAEALAEPIRSVALRC